jgi:cytochrome c peroxidase
MNRAAGPVLGVAFLAGSLALLSGTLVAQERSGPQRLEAAPEELRNIQRHGPWPQPVPRDPSNRASGKAEAIELGRALFFDARLSPRGDLSCAACHQPGRALTDGRARAQGGAARPRLDRNVPGLWNTGHARWYGWDGGSDSLWSFALRPLLHPDEMGATPAHVAQILRSDATLACRYRNAFGRNVPPAAAAESVLVDAAKALAAYLETLVSGKSAFDEFRDALARGDAAAVARYPDAARRGLALFAGKGQCSVCHFGPNFSNGEFHNIGVPHLVEPGRVDPGRHGGIKRVREDKYNLLGVYSDDVKRASGSRTLHLAESHVTYGQFKVPSLRNVELTAPYMHDGRFATLRDVVRHYSELDEDRLHQDGEALLKALRLSDEESEDLVAFLRTLTSLSFPDLNPAAGPCKRRDRR